MKRDAGSRVRRVVQFRPLHSLLEKRARLHSDRSPDIMQVAHLGAEPRQRGNVVVAFAIAAAILLVAGVLFFLFSKNNTVVVAPAPVTANPPQTAAGDVVDSVEIARPAETAVVPPAAEATRAATSSRHDYILFGTVQTVEETPINGARVRIVSNAGFDVDTLHAAAFDGQLDADSVRAHLPVKLRTALETSTSTSTNEDGSYEVKMPTSADGLMVAIVSKEGYATSVQTLARTAPRSSDDADGTADDNTVRERRDFTLPAGHKISGTVSDAANGEPAAGVQVIAIQVDDEAAPVFLGSFDDGIPTATAGDDGAYSLSGLAPHRYRILAQPGSSLYAPMRGKEAKQVTLTTAEDLVVDLQVRLGGRIQGVVRAPDGAPIAEARCRVAPTDFMNSAMRGDFDDMRWFTDDGQKSDADGRFDFTGLPLDKRYLVVAKADGYAAAHIKTRELTAERPEIELEMEPSLGLKISGRVLYTSAAPAGGIRVRVQPNFGELMQSGLAALIDQDRNDKTNDDGDFELDDLSGGKYRLTAGDDQPNPFSQNQDATEVELGDIDVAGVIITIPDPEVVTESSIAGIVLDDTGAPVARAQVSFGSLENMMIGTQSVRTDDDGRFVANNLRGTEFRLEATKDSYTKSTLSGVQGGRTDVQLTLLRNGKIEGRLVTAAGEPLAGGAVRAVAVDADAGVAAFVMAMQKGGEDDVKSRPDGTFSIDAPAGDVRVIARVPGYAKAKSDKLSVEAGTTTSEIEIIVTIGSILRGRVVDEAGAGVEGATVHVREDTGDKASEAMENMMPMFAASGLGATTDADGFYAVEHLAAGKYRLSASHTALSPSDVTKIEIGVDEDVNVPATGLVERRLACRNDPSSRQAEAGSHASAHGRRPHETSDGRCPRTV